MTGAISARSHLPFSLPHRATLALLLLICGPLHAQDLIWSDEFEAGLLPDAAVWSYDLGATGWGNQELQEYTNNAENAYIESGNLVISARETLSGASRVGFTSARLRTEGKLIVRYGTIEARIKVPDLADGLWPAFWTLGNDLRQVGWPDCGETDILEMGWGGAVNDGLVNRWVVSAAHWESDGAHAAYARTYRSSLVEPAGLNKDYHLFTLEWTPQRLTTYLDRREIWAMDISSENCSDCAEFHQPHFIILNLAVGGTFTGRFNPAQITAPLPANMLVDYVRIYDNGYTEVTGSGFNPGPPDIGPAHSGSWYNPDQSGQGFSMEFGELPDGMPVATIYWYTYDDQGNPIFMLGTGSPQGNRVDVSFESPIGMVYGDFDSDTVSRKDGGTGVVEFQDRDNATFSYTPSAFSTTHWGHAQGIEALPLVKLLGIPARLHFSAAEEP